MAKAHATWIVLPHRPIEKLSERLWRVEGDLPRGPVKRVMAIARRADGSLVIHNAIALDPAEMAELDAWGKVTMIAVPNGFHRLDSKVFSDRYPDAEVVCPRAARAKVEQVVKVTRTYDEIPGDEAIAFEHIDGTKQREGAMIVRGSDGTSVVLNDLIFNMPHQSGFGGFVLKRLTGSSGGPRVSLISRMVIVADKAAVRAHIERLAALPDLRRVLVAHHQTIADNPAEVLREVAAAL